MFGPAMHDSPFRRKPSNPRERKPRQDREHAEAAALMQIVRAHESRWPALVRFFAVPNGGARSKASAGKMKAEGVRRGVPDYLWPLKVGSCPGLALELKAKGGRLAPEHREWIDHLQLQGWLCVVAYGADEAWAAIRAYAVSHHIESQS